MKKLTNDNLSYVLKYTYNHKKSEHQCVRFFVATRRGLVDQFGTKL